MPFGELWWAGLGRASIGTDTNRAINGRLGEPFQKDLTYGRFTVDQHLIGAGVVADVFFKGVRIGFGVWTTSEENARALMPMAQNLLREMGITAIPSVWTLPYGRPS